MTSIVGVCLVKNEQNFVAWALMNVVQFCDKILVMDNMSEDRTKEIVDSIAAQYNHIEVIQVKHGHKTHKFIEDYVNSSSWILKIDGDEIYDPVGLTTLRKKLLEGEFDQYWSVQAYSTHVLGINFEKSISFGFVPPDAEPGLFMVNMNSMVKWRAKNKERLHGHKNIVFKPGFSRDRVYCYWKEKSWTESEFKVLHLCFLPRTTIKITQSQDTQLENRLNFIDLRFDRRVRRFFSKNYSSKPSWSVRNYARGEIKTLDILNFGSPINFCKYHPESEQVMQHVREVSIRRAELIRTNKLKY